MVYTSGENKGKVKSLEDMTDAEKQRYYFQKWWSKNKKAIMKLFGIGGKYETTNLYFKSGRQPLGFWENLLWGSSAAETQYRGRTAWGERGTKESDLYVGSKEITANFGLDKLDVYFYINPDAYDPLSRTPGHEWDHGKIIIDAVKNGKAVPNGMKQHELMNSGQVPIIK